MRYLDHVEASIDRLGYLKPEYAPALAILMEENQGEHPRQMARRFRQTGTPLPVEGKRALGMRANAEMSVECAAALTERGLSSPIAGIELTVLDASFRYFRARSIAAARQAGYDSFRVDGIFAAECQGCARLHGQKVTGDFAAEIPPVDCDREACAIGLHLHIDFVEQHRAKLEAAKPSLLRRLFGKRSR